MSNILALVGALLLGVEVIEGMMAFGILLYAPILRLYQLYRKIYVSNAEESRGLAKRVTRQFTLVLILVISVPVSSLGALILIISVVAWGVRKVDNYMGSVTLNLLTPDRTAFMIREITNHDLWFITKPASWSIWMMERLYPGETAKRLRCNLHKGIRTGGPISGAVNDLELRLTKNGNVPFVGIVGVFLIVASFAIKVF